MIDELNQASDQLSTADSMVEQMSFMMFGAVVTATKAFGDVEIKMNAESQRVFIAITLRWFAKGKKLEALRKYWLAKAERKVQPYVPKGYRVLMYYKQEG